MKKNEIDLRLVISDFNDITHDEITQLLGIEPTFIRLKGEKKNPKRSDSPLIQFNTWAVNSKRDKYANFDEHVTSLLDIIETKIDALNRFAINTFVKFLAECLYILTTRKVRLGYIWMPDTIVLFGF